MKYQYQVYSPDNIAINYDTTYASLAEAKKALALFVTRYTEQGYYSHSNGYRRPLNEIAEKCSIERLDN